MKKRFVFLAVVMLFALCLVLTSCDMFSGLIGGTKPAEPTRADCKFENVSVTYDGTPKTIAVTGLPEGASVTYSVNGGEAVSAVSVTDAGTYTVVAKVTLPEGYAPQADMTATLTVAKANYELPALEGDAKYFENAEVKYDGLYHTPTPAVDLPEGISYSVAGDPVLNAGAVGTYTVTFGFSDPAMAANYNPPAAITGITLTMVKGDIDMSGVLFEDATVPYDGMYHSLTLSGTIPEMLEYDVLGGGKARGPHTVTASFSFKNAADAANYNLPADLTATLTIGAGAFDLSSFNFKDRVVEYTGRDQYPIFAEKDGLTITTAVKKNGAAVDEVKLPGTYEVTVTFAVEDENEYITPDPITFTITIEKGIFGVLTAPVWAPVGGWDATVGGNGFFILEAGETAHAVELQLPADLLDPELGTVNVTYVHTLNGNPVTELAAAGAYKTTATITYTSDLYNLPEGFALEYTYEWRVADKAVDPAELDFADAAVIYNGAAQKIELVYDEMSFAYITGVTYSYLDAEGNPIEAPVDAGVYTVVACVETSAVSGYAPFELTAELTVAPAVIDLSGVTFIWNYTEPFAMDGTAHSVTLSAETVSALETLGVKVASYTGNAATEKGEYTAVANLTCDDNHTLSDATAELAWAIALGDEDSWSDLVP